MFDNKDYPDVPKDQGSVDQRPSVASLPDQSFGQDSLPLRLKGSPANVADCEGILLAYGTVKSSAPRLSDRLWHVSVLTLGHFGGCKLY